MPTCPGCDRSVTYEELQLHVRTCKWIWSEAPERESRQRERLAGQVRQLADRVSRIDDSDRPPGPAADRPSRDQDGTR